MASSKDITRVILSIRSFESCTAARVSHVLRLGLKPRALELVETKTNGWCRDSVAEPVLESVSQPGLSQRLSDPGLGRLAA